MRDFDFLVGSWHVADRRLVRRHVGSDEGGIPRLHRGAELLRGRRQLDEITFPTKGFAGSTVRI